MKPVGAKKVIRLALKMKKMMKRLIACIALLLLVLQTPVVHAQDKGLQRIHAAKMSYLVDRLKLDDRQASRFTAIYNDYERDLRVIRRSFYKKHHVRLLEIDRAENMAARQRVEEDLDYQQKVIELKRSYNDRYLAIMSADQLADMYVAEKEFRQLLMKRLSVKKMRLRAK
jgi:hypothetical protein